MARLLAAPGLERRAIASARLWLTAPGAWAGPTDVVGDSLAASVPGTVAGALRAAGKWTTGDPRDLDREDAWFRFALDVPDDGRRWRLRFERLATPGQAWVGPGSAPIALAALQPQHLALPPGPVEVVVMFPALATALAQKWPRPRWKTRLVASQNMRFVRTTLLGRMPAFASAPAVVGPIGEVVLEGAPGPMPEVDLQVAMRGDDGVVTLATRGVYGAGTTLRIGDHAVALDADGGAQLVVPTPVRWWPHTHGPPTTYAARLDLADGGLVDLGAVGFRDVHLEAGALRVNGVRVFARGGAWMPIDPVGFVDDPPALRRALIQARDAGVNMLRLPGTGCYETAGFHALCDELGIMVWQDALLANLDYPTEAAFAATIAAEVGALLEGVQASPSLVVLCGGSEIEQQATMWGHPPAELAWPLLDDVIPRAARALRPDLVYVRNSPTGGALPFHVGTGVAHYYGVGAYLRPLDDARRAAVPFASECLAFANVGETFAIDAGVPRDVGAAWDFADVRDHYLALLYRVDASTLRTADPARYAALARVTTGEVMAATFAEWRRAGSVTAGALVWTWRDVMPGSGWGVVDVDGAAKPAYWYLRRAWAPIAVLATDEGQDGVVLHVCNDRPRPLHATLRVRALRDGALAIADGRHAVTVPPHGVAAISVDAVFGRFVDSAYAYRFGPPGHDAIVAALLDDAGAVLAETVHFPVGRPSAPPPGLDLGAALVDRDGARHLTLAPSHVAHAVAITAPGMCLDDNYVTVAPDQPRTIVLTGGATGSVTVQPLGGIAVTVPTR